MNLILHIASLFAKRSLGKSTGVAKRDFHVMHTQHENGVPKIVYISHDLTHAAETDTGNAQIGCEPIKSDSFCNSSEAPSTQIKDHCKNLYSNTIAAQPPVPVISERIRRLRN